VNLFAPVSEQTERLKARTMRFALKVCELIQQLPTSEPGPTAKRQLAKICDGRRFQLSRFLPFAIARRVHLEDQHCC
jgi:hypothetical protein